jgi:hypothetical protein
MSGSQTSTQQTNSTSKSEPWGPWGDAAKKGYFHFGDLLDKHPLSYYPGQTFATFSPPTLAALQMQTNRALQGSPLVGAAQQGALGTISGDYLGGPGGALGAGINSMIKHGVQGGWSEKAPTTGLPFSNTGTRTLDSVAGGSFLDAENPHFQTMADRVKAEVMPATYAGFGNSGGAGGLYGRAQGLGLGDAIGALAYQNYARERGATDNAAGALAGLGSTSYEGAQNRNAAGANALLSANTQAKLGALGIGANLWNSERGRMMTGLALAPELANQDYYDIAKLGEVGAALEGKQNQAIQEAMARYNFNMNAPWQMGAQYMQGIGGMIPGTVTTNGTTTTTQPGANPFQLGMGALFGGVGLAGKLGWQPFGPAIGAAGGGFV